MKNINNEKFENDWLIQAQKRHSGYSSSSDGNTQNFHSSKSNAMVVRKHGKFFWAGNAVIFISIFAIYMSLSAFFFPVSGLFRKSIAVIDVSGTISSGEGGFGEDNTFDGAWATTTIKKLSNDHSNVAILLRVNTPGGSAAVTDDIYHEIICYKKNTGRPVYAYFNNIAASGGYYISAPSDKIYCNKNCWTGSIGVTTGTMYNIKDFLREHGIKTEAFTSGRNKAMGSMTEDLTDEQRAILQSLIDEAYEQFVSVVAKGRRMPVEDVKTLADGRVYTAQQAKKHGLVDKICYEDEAISDIKKFQYLKDCKLKYFEPDDKRSSLLPFKNLIPGISRKSGSMLKNTYKEIFDIAENGNVFLVSYISNIRR